MINFYGLFISLAVLILVFFVEKILKKEFGDPKTQKLMLDHYWTLVFWGIIFSLIFGRLYHVLSEWPYYLENLTSIPNIGSGGMSIIGVIFGCGLTLLLFTRRTGKKYTFWTDLITLGAPLAQAIGRLGNYFNQELFGPPTNLPWGIYISPEHRPTEFIQFTSFHPLFLYEALLNIGLFIFLFTLYVKKSFRFGGGVITGIYLAGYGLIRFFLEFLRIETWRINNLNVAQTICILGITIGLIFIFRFKKYENISGQ